MGFWWRTFHIFPPPGPNGPRTPAGYFTKLLPYQSSSSVERMAPLATSYGVINQLITGGHHIVSMNYLSSIRWFTNQPPVTPVTNITLPACQQFIFRIILPVANHQFSSTSPSGLLMYLAVKGRADQQGWPMAPFFFGSIDSIAQCSYKKIFVDRHSVG